jgi:hypothetical protein
MNELAARVVFSLAVYLGALAAPIAAQDDPPQGPANPAFEQGEPGAAPDGWYFVSTSGAKVTIDADEKFEGEHAARIDATEPTGSGQRFSNLMQSIDATPWRGKRVRYRGAVRATELGAASRAQLWFRVDRSEGSNGERQIGAFDNMDDRPIRSSTWAHYDIVLDVADDAARIALGMFVVGTGRAWLDDVSIAVADASVAPTAEDRTNAAVSSGLSPLLQKALAEAHLAPQQPFFTPWLLSAAVVILLFVVGLWPVRSTTDPEAPPRNVGAVRWFALRFTVAYWLIYCLPVPLPQLVALVPGIGPALATALTEGHRWVEATLAHWTAHNLFGIEGELVPPNGSGDTTYGYLSALNGAVLALALAIGWTVLAGRRPRRPVTTDLLRSYLRYVLAFAMLGYGLAKVTVTHNQFPTIDEWRLGRTWGETSPMGVVWAFMGASRPYTMFAGLGEVLGAVLLVWRHTAVPGALVSLAVMTNIVLLNYCYDVPVKLYSTHLLLMAVLILVPDARRLFGLFVLQRGAERLGTENPWRGKVLPWVRWPLKIAVIVFGFGLPLWRTSVELWEHATAKPAVVAPSAAGDDARLLTQRGYRWISEVPFNR